MRLVNGHDVSEGRLEVSYEGLWGTVCDDGFTEVTAGVVCRSLGFLSGVPVFNAGFGEG